jgi:hypothetical protein
MNNVIIQIAEKTDAKELTDLLNSPKQEEIIAPDFSDKGGPDVDKALQLSKMRNSQLMEQAERIKKESRIQGIFIIRDKKEKLRVKKDKEFDNEEQYKSQINSQSFGLNFLLFLSSQFMIFMDVPDHEAPDFTSIHKRNGFIP